MTPILILDEAQIELWEAVAFYENRCAGLGLDFEKEIKASLETISGLLPSLTAEGSRGTGRHGPRRPSLRPGGDANKIVFVRGVFADGWWSGSTVGNHGRRIVRVWACGPGVTCICWVTGSPSRGVMVTL